ncbi:MAG TPA: hypothetical protein VLL69_14800 [Streptosporangiaceae bacterium]|nr:hypothetical protein [Streptosporangiaceae bacterium]
MATNQSSASGAAAVFRDVVKVCPRTAGPAAAAILRWRRAASATA